MNNFKKGVIIGLLSLIVTCVFGCAFDLMDIKYHPAKIDPASEINSFTLEEDVNLDNLLCGYNRTLVKGKKWTIVGRIEKGEVYKPVGHCFTVECSNVFEAYLVLNEDQLCGFYLPVEKGFVELAEFVKLPIKN